MNLIQELKDDLEAMLAHARAGGRHAIEDFERLLGRAHAVEQHVQGLVAGAATTIVNNTSTPIMASAIANGDGSSTLKIEPAGGDSAVSTTSAAGATAQDADAAAEAAAASDGGVGAPQANAGAADAPADHA